MASGRRFILITLYSFVLNFKWTQDLNIIPVTLNLIEAKNGTVKDFLIRTTGTKNNI